MTNPNFLGDQAVCTSDHLRNVIHHGGTEIPGRFAVAWLPLGQVDSNLLSSLFHLRIPRVARCIESRTIARVNVQGVEEKKRASRSPTGKIHCPAD